MAEHSPTPWRLVGQTIRDAEGAVVMSAFNPADMETRRLIVDAVNAVDATRKLQRTLLGWSIERARLAAFVRELADCLEEVDGTAFRSLIDRAREATQGRPQCKR